MLFKVCQVTAIGYGEDIYWHGGLLLLVTFFSETLSGAFLSYSLVKLKKMASTLSTAIFVILSACSLMRATAITGMLNHFCVSLTKLAC